MASPIYLGKRSFLLVVGATLILQLSITIHGAGADNSLAIDKTNCPDKCGNVSIPYPFGIGQGCYLHEDFEVQCKNNQASLRTRGSTDQKDDGYSNSNLLDINLLDGEARIQNRVYWSCKNNGSIERNPYDGQVELLLPSFFKVSYTKNKFTAIGCATIANIVGSTDGTTDLNNLHYTGVCASFCDSQHGISKSAVCDGLGCCQTSIPENLSAFHIGLFYTDRLIRSPYVQPFSPCSYAFVVEVSSFKFNTDYALGSNFQNQDRLPLVLDWNVGNEICEQAKKNLSSYACKATNSECINATNGPGYRCNCSSGYEGNPYLSEGCQDIDECDFPLSNPCNGNKCTNRIGSYICSCPAGTRSTDPENIPCTTAIGLSIGIGVGSAAGFILLVLIAIYMTRKMKHRRATNLKRRFFQQNRGQLLEQLVSQRADIAERMIIKVSELAKATNNFDKARELGGGGHGTVYKGIMLDLQVVAIKKSKITVRKEIDEFINEVAILSQINHRNVVKLFGCCLETEVPLLVYEFISNGTLYHHLHVEGPRSLAWSNRLRIAAEIASALSYLHSWVSIPIIHRDIKSTNILLDDTMTSKVSDFGASRYVPLDKSGLTTMVQGTMGYLDPMYFYTCRLTDKSDVYSFGVILMELLTKKKPFSYLSSKGDGIVAHFVNLHGTGNLVEILDPQVMDEGGKEVHEVAVLAVACVMLRPEDRPTMRQADITLEGLLSSNRHAENNTLADGFEEIGNMVMDFPSIDEGQSTGESTQYYSLEQDRPLMLSGSR
ncbi:unnamed protein product [Urochloa decumbens]|uniref:Uncharacterized protein n=1 Tax=Urochloa decumbens TaxID=240449 RepID=A0ABC9DXE8_9POAL